MMKRFTTEMSFKAWDYYYFFLIISDDGFEKVQTVAKL